MRLRSIDFLRFIAVFLVIIRHHDFVAVNGTDNCAYLFVKGIQKIGWIGVDLFFVISGFLISGLIFNEVEKTGHFKPIRFLIRRGFKIYPSFYILILVTAIVYWLQHALNTVQLKAELVYLQNYFAGFWAHTWSLAVEEHFYFFLAFLFFLWPGGKKKITGIAVMMVVLIVAINILKTTQAHTISETNRVTFYTHLRIDALFFGVLINYFYTYHRQICTWWQQRVSAIAAIVLLPVVYFVASKSIYDASQLQYGYTFLYLYFGNLLLFILHAEHIFRNRIFSLPSSLGFYSYSVYLWHLPCYFWLLPVVDEYIHPGYWLKLLIYVAASFGIGIVLSRLIEIPFLSIRDKWFPAAMQKKV